MRGRLRHEEDERDAGESELALAPLGLRLNRYDREIDDAIAQPGLELHLVPGRKAEE